MIRLCTACTNLLQFKHKPWHKQFSFALDVCQIPINHPANLAVCRFAGASAASHRRMRDQGWLPGLFCRPLSVSMQHKTRMYHADPHIMSILCFSVTCWPPLCRKTHWASDAITTIHNITPQHKTVIWLHSVPCLYFNTIKQHWANQSARG